MTHQPPHPSSGCSTCLDYLADRLGALRPHLVATAASTGSTAQLVLEEYMTRVHARHQAGGSLDVAPAQTVEIRVVAGKPYRPCRACRLGGRTHRSRRRAHEAAALAGAVQ